MMRIAFSIFMCGVFAFMFSCGGTQPTNVAVNTANNAANRATPLPAATIDELSSGKKIYESSCVLCHKEDGTGGEVVIEGKELHPEDLTSAKIKAFSDEKILGYIKNGVPDEGMPAFKEKLSEGEMRDVLRYVRVELQKMPASNSPANVPANAASMAN